MAIRNINGVIDKELLKLIHEKNMQRIKSGKLPLPRTKIQKQICTIIQGDTLLYDKFIKL